MGYDPSICGLVPSTDEPCPGMSGRCEPSGENGKSNLTGTTLGFKQSNTQTGGGNHVVVNVKWGLLGLLPAAAVTVGWRMQLFPIQTGARLVPDIRVSTAYSAEDAGEIKLAGVCDVIGPEMRCWDASGKADADLTTQVADIFKQRAESDSNGNEIPFRFRRKNRLAVFSGPPQGSRSDSKADLNGFFDGSNMYLQDLNRDFNPRAKSHFYCITMTEPSDAATGSMFVRFYIRSQHLVQIPLKAGATADVESHTVTIASIQKQSTLGFFGGEQGTRADWNTQLTISGDVPNSKLDLTVVPLDANGKQIMVTDEQGRPIAPARPKAKPGPNANTGPALNMSVSIPNVNYSTGQYWTSSGGRIWECCVDPKYVATIQLNLATFRIVEFDGIPLDPKE